MQTLQTKKQVLIFCHGYNLPFVDVCNQYAQVFDKTQYEISVVYLVGVADDKVRQKTHADHVYFLDQAQPTVRNLKLTVVKKMLQLCRQKNFSIVICHRYKPMYIMSLVALFIKFSHFFAVMHELNTLRRLPRRIFIYLLARHKIIFAGVSSAVQQNILRDAPWLNPNRVIVLPNTIDVTATEQQLFDKEQARQQLGLHSNDFVFGNIGRLVKNKDQASLIKAFANVYNKHNTAKLIIIGSGVLAIQLQQLVNTLGLQEQVILPGFVADAFRLIKAFDVYVSSSTQEAFGRVLLEAMVAKVPIIATCIHGVPEVLGETGILTPPGNPELLAATMTDSIDSPTTQLLQRGEQGYRRVCAYFSQMHFQQQFLELLN